MKIYLNKKYSYPIEILGKVKIDGVSYYVTKATPVEEDMEVVVKLLKYADVANGLTKGKYSLKPAKEVKERSSVLDYADSHLCLEFYEAGYEDALEDLNVWHPETEEEKQEQANEELKTYSIYPEIFHLLTPEEKILTTIGFELPKKRLDYYNSLLKK